ncbi:HD domain-containing phosphohydrolase [Oscillospiraceae bacterium PP1C4]
MSDIQVLDEVKNKMIDPWKLYQSMDAGLLEHSESVATYAYILYEIALKNRYYPDEIIYDKLFFIKHAAIYHDIGKAYLEPKLLNYKGILSQNQRDEIETHVNIGMDIFKHIFKHNNISEASAHYLDCVRDCIFHHHENIDGTGYPNRLRGHEISALGKICAIADYYDALTSNRVYRKALPVQDVLQDMKLQMGYKFDPLLLSLFLENHKLFSCRQ